MRTSDYTFVTQDTDKLVSEMTAAYEKICGITVLPASPEKLFIMWVANVMLNERVYLNYVGNQNIPSRASDENLDALAQLYYQQERPKSKAATVTVRFTISEASTGTITIPLGTRITDAAKTVYWKTLNQGIIDAGSTYVDVKCQCESEGTIGNGFAVGQITEVVDLYDYVYTVSNTTASDGGADVPDDDEFYKLLRKSMDAFSVAGARGAYEYWASQVSTEIGDVKAVRPSTVTNKQLNVYAHKAFFGGDGYKTGSLVVKTTAGAACTEGTDYTASFDGHMMTITTKSGGAIYDAAKISVSYELDGAGVVQVYALMDDGTPATAEIKDAILAACSADDVRPLTDNVSVQDPTEVSYNINVDYYIEKGNAASADEIGRKAAAAVDEYAVWQSAKLGRDINPSVLIQKLMDAGVKRVVVNSPSFTKVSDGTAGTAPGYCVLGTKTVTYRGLETE